jgi:hypothetical protein
MLLAAPHDDPPAERRTHSGDGGRLNARPGLSQIPGAGGLHFRPAGIGGVHESIGSRPPNILNRQ